MGARIPPEQAAPGAAPAAPQGQAQAQGEDQLQQLVVGVGEGLATLTQVVGQVSPDLGQQMAAIMQQYEQIINSLGGGGQPAAGGPAAGGPVTPEAGVAPVQQAM